MSTFAERLYRITKRHPTLSSKGKLAEFLGISRSMLYNYESGNPSPPAEVLDKVIKLEVSLGVEGEKNVQNPAAFDQLRGIRRIPVLGWAHAGQAASYEELPQDWVDWIPTDCRDEKAFAVRLEGDSMEGTGRHSFHEGDLLVLMPSERIHNGCLAVVRMACDGVLFRRIETRGDMMRLVPFNPRYEAENIPADKISWAYPVWGRWSQLWK